jgi:two-component system, OmpR family, sensor histidine kinase KdpD
LSFLVTALVITELVVKARAEALSALRDRQRLDNLYQLSQRLLAVKPEAVGTAEFLEHYLGTFGITAVCLFDGEGGTLHASGASTHGLPERTRDCFVSGQNYDDGSGVCVHCLRVGVRLTGAIGFENLQKSELTGGSLATLTATLWERSRALREAANATAAAQAEVYRSAILDALAHEFKTPLATVSAAAGGLAEAGHLNLEQLDLIEMIEDETARLGALTSRLLRMSRLEREEVKPRMEMVELAAILERVVEQQCHRYPDRNFCIASPPPDLEVRADPELLRLALNQLVDNACKYSRPGSSVKILVEQPAEAVVIRVSNTGSSILPADERRIFERFYRGGVSQQLAPGSGLGLFVARKIAAAHGGGLELEARERADSDVTFRFTISASQKVEVDHVVTTN